jgi:hypothetical protein
MTRSGQLPSDSVQAIAGVRVGNLPRQSHRGVGGLTAPDIDKVFGLSHMGLSEYFRLFTAQYELLTSFPELREINSQVEIDVLLAVS